MYAHKYMGLQLCLGFVHFSSGPFLFQRGSFLVQWGVLVWSNGGSFLVQWGFFFGPIGVLFWSNGGSFLVQWGFFFGPKGFFFVPMGVLVCSNGVLFCSNGGSFLVSLFIKPCCQVSCSFCVTYFIFSGADFFLLLTTGCSVLIDGGMGRDRLGSYLGIVWRQTRWCLCIKLDFDLVFSVSTRDSLVVRGERNLFAFDFVFEPMVYVKKTICAILIECGLFSMPKTVGKCSKRIGIGQKKWKDVAELCSLPGSRKILCGATGEAVAGRSVATMPVCRGKQRRSRGRTWEWGTTFNIRRVCTVFAETNALGA